MKWSLLALVLAGGCAVRTGTPVLAECDGSTLLCDEGASYCEGDPDAYVVCGHEGAYCRRFNGRVDVPVDAPAICIE